jgi:hypothetical protein
MPAVSNSQLHQAQVSILKTLRRAESVRYKDMRLPTELDSDVFKFHLRKLVKLGYIRKLPTSYYELSASGKEFANNLDEQARVQQKQPKLSLVMVASRPDASGQDLFLLQQRFRNPFWGFWGLVSGPAHWGVPFEETAAAEFQKQTGLSASFEVRSFCRQRDYGTASGNLLEDKLFVVLSASRLRGRLGSMWLGGSNKWMALGELERQSHYFKGTPRLIDLAQGSEPFASHEVVYGADDY